HDDSFGPCEHALSTSAALSTTAQSYPAGAASGQPSPRQCPRLVVGPALPAEGPADVRNARRWLHDEAAVPPGERRAEHDHPLLAATDDDLGGDDAARTVG